MGRALRISSSLGVLNAWVGHWLLGSFTEELTPVKTLCCSVRCVPIYSVSTAISALDHASSATREATEGEGVGREASSRVRVLRLSFLGRISSVKVSQRRPRSIRNVYSRVRPLGTGNAISWSRMTQPTPAERNETSPPYPPKRCEKTAIRRRSAAWCKLELSTLTAGDKQIHPSGPVYETT